MARRIDLPQESTSNVTNKLVTKGENILVQELPPIPATLQPDLIDRFRPTDPRYHATAYAMNIG
jgi:hypothetical protein